MRTFKMIDLRLQAGLIIGGIIYAIAGLSNSGIHPIYSYIVVGSWQVISYCIHYFFFMPTIFQSERIQYGKIVLAILIIGSVLLIPVLFQLSMTVPFLFVYLIALLIISPFLAIYYLVICWKEYRLIIKRELIHLK